jgi:hypothetical protein
VASFFTLTLDTTAPVIATTNIAGGATYITARATTIDTTLTGGSDVSQMKVWGSVDTSADANIQATEGASSWVTYSASKAITVSTGDGTKTINVRVRDDAGNESSPTSDTITLDTTAPVATVSVAPSPTKISKIATFDTSTFQFQADVAIQAWKVKVVGSTGAAENTGTTIPTTAGSTNVTGGALAATTNQTVTIKGTDLETASAGDGAKIVKVFVQDLAGNWSTA